jgi:DNA invertase Pin-like site-specific DNA recombinase
MQAQVKTAAVYARVSTRDKEQNPETQLLALREYAARRSYTIVDEYVDNGFSGSKSSRPALDQMMKDARRGRFDAVIVWRFDRFGRSVKQLVLALEEFKALDVGFISLSESIDTTTPMGKMIFAVTAAFSEFLLDITRENVCAGLDRARKEGKVIGRPKRIVDRERVLRLYAEHRSCRTVAELSGIGKDKVAAIVNDAKARSGATV